MKPVAWERGFVNPPPSKVLAGGVVLESLNSRVLVQVPALTHARGKELFGAREVFNVVLCSLAFSSVCVCGGGGLRYKYRSIQSLENGIGDTVLL